MLITQLVSVRAPSHDASGFMSASLVVASLRLVLLPVCSNPFGFEVECPLKCPILKRHINNCCLATVLGSLDMGKSSCFGGTGSLSNKAPTYTRKPDLRFQPFRKVLNIGWIAREDLLPTPRVAKKGGLQQEQRFGREMNMVSGKLNHVLERQNGIVKLRRFAVQKEEASTLTTPEHHPG